MRKRLYKITVFLLLLTIMHACDEGLLVEKPPHLITAETLYTDLSGLETGLTGLYAMVQWELRGRSNDGDQRLMGGPFHYGNDVFTSNNPTSGMSTVAQFWGDANNAFNVGYVASFRWLYELINSANTVINRASRDDVNWSGGGASPADNKNRLLAEARAIRAWAYRHLSFGWGDVPLTLEESSGTTIRTDWVRTPVAEVREKIIEDLLFAEQHIGVEEFRQGRLTKGAVQHYLAEMYLAIGDPQSAFSWANKVLSTPEYKLVTERYGVKRNQPGTVWTDIFQDGNQNRANGNTEALWVFQYAYQVIGSSNAIRRRVHSSRYQFINIGGVTPFRLTFERGGRGESRSAMTKWLIDSYEPEDNRASEFAIRKFFILSTEEENTGAAADNLPPGMNYGDTVWCNWSQPISPTFRNRNDWPFSRKFEGVVPHNPDERGQYEDQIYLRIADTYLLKAEAEYKLNRPGDAAATINILRRRANASEITAADVNIDFILDERARELFFEEQRTWTLRRTGKWFERTKAHNLNGGQLITARDTIYPIPQVVIDANITVPMPQNPMY